MKQDIFSTEDKLVFAANLRVLIQREGITATKLSEDTGIPRQQISRYLSGASSPIPDRLSEICTYFGTDARILFDPIDRIDTPEIPLNQALGLPAAALSPQNVSMEDGFYRVWKPAFAFKDTMNVSLVTVTSQSGIKVARGIDPTAFHNDAGSNSRLISLREHTGVLCDYAGGVVAFFGMARRRNLTCTILRPELGYRSSEGSFFGVCTTTASDSTMVTSGAVGIVYERLSQTTSGILAAARQCGRKHTADLPINIQELLQAALKA